MSNCTKCPALKNVESKLSFKMEKNEDSDLLELQVNPIFVHARSAVHSFRGDKYLTQTDIADFRIYNYAVSNQVLWQLEQMVGK